MVLCAGKVFANPSAILEILLKTRFLPLKETTRHRTSPRHDHNNFSRVSHSLLTTQSFQTVPLVFLRAARSTSPYTISALVNARESPQRPPDSAPPPHP